MRYFGLAYFERGFGCGRETILEYFKIQIFIQILIFYIPDFYIKFKHTYFVNNYTAKFAIKITFDLLFSIIIIDIPIYVLLPKIFIQLLAFSF